MKHVVDAHALIWFLQMDKRLGLAARQVLSDPRSELVLPATAYGEVCWIVERGRTNIPSVTVLQAAVEADRSIVIHPLDRAIVDQSQSLTMIGEMHDRQIAATAIVLAEQGSQVTLITRSENITASGVVATLR